MSRILILFFLILFIGCSVQKQRRAAEIHTINKIISVEEFEYVSYFKTVDIKLKDTIYILSFKEKYYEKYNLDKPILNTDTPDSKQNDTVRFILSKAKFRVGKMEQLGARIIVENDTLWKGPKAIFNKFFVSMNSVGRKIKLNQ